MFWMSCLFVQLKGKLAPATSRSRTVGLIFMRLATHELCLLLGSSLRCLWCEFSCFFRLFGKFNERSAGLARCGEIHPYTRYEVRQSMRNSWLFVYGRSRGADSSRMPTNRIYPPSYLSTTIQMNMWLHARKSVSNHCNWSRNAQYEWKSTFFSPIFSETNLNQPTMWRRYVTNTFIRASSDRHHCFVRLHMTRRFLFAVIAVDSIVSCVCVHCNRSPLCGKWHKQNSIFRQTQFDGRSR